jgi:hypothetical protein
MATASPVQTLIFFRSIIDTDLQIAPGYRVQKDFQIRNTLHGTLRKCWYNVIDGMFLYISIMWSMYRGISTLARFYVHDLVVFIKCHSHS